MLKVGRKCAKRPGDNQGGLSMMTRFNDWVTRARSAPPRARSILNPRGRHAMGRRRMTSLHPSNLVSSLQSCISCNSLE